MGVVLKDLRDQHRRLAIRAEELKNHLAPGLLEADPAAAHRAFVPFGMLLRAHLEQEDLYFYPKARNHGACGAIVAKFEKDMGHLRATAEAYILGWPDALSIANDPHGFRDYTEALLRVLARRIAAEEQELFPPLESEGI